VKKNPSWTPDEDRLLILHREAGRTSKEIAAFINRAPHAISARWRYINLDTEKRQEERRAKGSSKSKEIFQLEQRVTVPDYILEDRNRRLSMMPSSITAMLMGDPIR